METKSKTKKKILIVTAFPTHGAGSGALITTQAKSYVENGDHLGRWINSFRVRYAKGQLSPHQISALEEIGMVWNAADSGK